MAKPEAQRPITFSQPIQQVVSMLIAIGLAAAGGWLIRDTVLHILGTNPALNAFILSVFALGIVTCFWQVLILVQSVSWIERVLNGAPGAESAAPPRLLAPLAALLKTRGTKAQISSSSARSILDSVATRIDEARDITRYLTNLLIFLGLLGTFYGLATTIPAIVETIKSLAPRDNETGLAIFERLMGGLQAQLGGMSTAFSSSLMGLAGSLLVGLLELFASHGQNRFYRELEDWLSSITRIGLTGSEGEAADTTVLAQILDNLTGQIEVLQTLYAQSEANRTADAEKMGQVAGALQALAARLEDGGGQTAVLTRIAEGQDRLIQAVSGTEGPGAGAGYSDAESRMRLRSIDVQLLRILEEISAGRQESIADLRSDITALTQAIRALSRGAVGRN
jgi:hypothetical protein